jgi:hypothetical protein
MELVRERLEPLLLARKRLRCCGRDVADRILKDSEAFTLRRDDGSVTGFQWWMRWVPRGCRPFTFGVCGMEWPLIRFREFSYQSWHRTRAVHVGAQRRLAESLL